MAKKGKGGGKGGKKRNRPPLPQPPAPIGPQQGQGGYYQYTPTAESAYNQPYQDLAAAGATGALGGVLGRIPQQGQMADIYGQGAAQTLGGAAQGMGQLAPLGGGYMGQSGGLLGQYGQLMNPNLGIQQGLATEIQGIQAGNLDVDPAMVQQMNQQEQLLNEQLRRQLGPDYATSSAGIEALGRFQQGKQTALASANFNRLQGLIGMQQGGMQNIANTGLGMGQFGAGVQGQQFGQGATLGNMYGGTANDLYTQAMGLRSNQLGGANQMLQNTAATQNLYASIPQTMGQFGQAMSGQAGAAVGAQGPYQQDRFGQLQASYSPTKGGYTGQMLQNQGDRLIASAAAMGGGGGGGGGMNPYQQGASGGGYY